MRQSGPVVPPVRVKGVNAGGGAAGEFAADSGATEGSQFSTTAAITGAGAVPAAVYQTERYGNFSYALTGLTPGGSYTVRLHFAEVYWGLAGRAGAGQRVFNVTVNGAAALSNFDIFQEAGAANKALVKEVSATADAQGRITVGFANVKNFAKVSGIEVFTR